MLGSKRQTLPALGFEAAATIGTVQARRRGLQAARVWATPGSHLVPAIIALLVVALGLAALTTYARGKEREFIHALAPVQWPQKSQGRVLEEAAFQQPDLLPLYGSSELASRSPNVASRMFSRYPTGFTVFPVGQAGATPLIFLEALGDLGSELTGKRVVISLTPGVFLDYTTSDDQTYYAGNFSRLHASGLVFSPDVSLALRQAAARRMLSYPATLQQSPLLRFALERLADDSPLSRVLYLGAIPLGRLQNLILELQDHWAVLTYLKDHPALSPDVKRQPATINWDRLLAEAERESQARHAAAPDRTDRLLSKERARHIQDRYRRNDPLFLAKVGQGDGWNDLDLLLHTITDLGARPLILSAPLNGRWYDRKHVSAQARASYYQEIVKVGARYQVPARVFAEHDEDTDFVADTRSHPADKGWLYYDQAIDAFFHQTTR